MLAPWILEQHKPHTIDLTGSQDRIRMKLDDALALTPASAPDASGAPEQEVLVDLHQLLVPEVLLVQDVGRVNLGRHAAREVLDAFAAIAALDGGIVAVRFGICLLEQRQPGLVGVGALSEVLSRLSAHRRELGHLLRLLGGNSPAHRCWIDTPCDRLPLN